MTNTPLPYGVVAAAITAFIEKNGPQTRAEVETGLPQYRHASRVLVRMHKQGDLHIDSWVRDIAGTKREYLRAVYNVGPGVDARKPPALSKAEKTRRYRAKAKKTALHKAFNQMVFAPPAP